MAGTRGRIGCCTVRGWRRRRHCGVYSRRRRYPCTRGAAIFRRGRGKVVGVKPGTLEYNKRNAGSSLDSLLDRIERARERLVLRERGSALNHGSRDDGNTHGAHTARLQLYYPARVTAAGSG